MMFRKLYWVTEQVDPSGTSSVTGVYTSIPDLIRHGLPKLSKSKYRLTLTKLDCEDGPLGAWLSPDFTGLDQSLQQFVQTDEFSPEHCQALSEALSTSKSTAA
jgi:hypothetical protein